MSGEAANRYDAEVGVGGSDTIDEADQQRRMRSLGREDRPDAHRLFGFLIAADLTLPFAPTEHAFVAPDLEIRRQDDLATDSFRRTSPVYVSPQLDLSGDPWFALYRSGGRDVLTVANTGEIAIADDLVHYHPMNDERLPRLVQFLLGAGLSFWLERRSIVVLHASVVEVDDRAVAFLATSGGGKSTLAAAFVSAGHPLISDDLLAVRANDNGLWALPGLPGMRLWTADAARLVGDERVLPRVLPDSDKRWVSIGVGGFGPLAPCPVPLGCIYMPSRVVENVEGVETRPVSRRDGFVELARYSFAGRLALAAGLAQSRTAVLARLTGSIPIARLSFTDGLDRLPAVVRSIETAVRQLRQGAVS